jgi:hypothetical protein
MRRTPEQESPSARRVFESVMTTLSACSVPLLLHVLGAPIRPSLGSVFPESVTDPRSNAII